MTWTEIFKSLVFWGPGAVIAGLIIFAVYKLATNIGMKFIDAQKEQAVAQGRQAQSMEGLTDSIQSFLLKDNSEHREMLVLLRFIAQQQQSFEEIKIEHNHRKESAHPNCPVKFAQD